MSTGAFPGVALTTHPHPAPRLKKEYSYTYLPLLDLRGLLYGELTFTFNTLK
jgi:hypothetical protein